MKKIILISIVASGMLFATLPSVSSLTTTNLNEIDNSASVSIKIKNSEVTQGLTVVSGDSAVSNVGIKQDNKILNTGIDISTVNQGLTHINDATIKGSKLNSTNTITKSSIENNSTVNQALTIVNNGAEVEETDVTSTNGLAGMITNNSTVSQATLEVNGEGSELDHSKITTTNYILASISASDVSQANVKIGGYKVSNLKKSGTNTIKGVIENSNVQQDNLLICSHSVDASDWCED